jgi:ubiquitin C-terminal hydrolase
LCPYLVTDHFYAGWQEDAGELLARHFLNSECAPVVADAVRGERSEVLKCTACGHRSLCGHDPFHEVQLPILSEDAVDAQFRSVGEALSEYMRGDLVFRAECCDGCGASNGQYEKLPEFVALPQVLVLVLKRWRVTSDGRGGHCQLCVPHSVRADRHLLLQGQDYDLKSSIIHLGSSADRGHYIAVARHPTSGGDWWLYDDGLRRLALPEEVLGEGKYRSTRDMKTYVLFYEKGGL